MRIEKEIDGPGGVWMLVRRLDRLAEGQGAAKDGRGEAGLVPALYVERLEGKAAKAVEPFRAQ